MVVEANKVVKINYTLKNKEGEVIDTSLDTEPLEYIHGQGYLLQKLEEQLEGKSVGDKIETVIAAADGYGEYDEQLVVEVDRENFETDMPIEEGAQFQAMTEYGPQVVTVRKVTDDKVTVDGNHELAGVELHFSVEIVDIRDATEEELSGGCGCGCGGECEGDCGEGCGCDGGCGCN